MQFGVTTIDVRVVGSAIDRSPVARELQGDISNSMVLFDGGTTALDGGTATSGTTTTVRPTTPENEDAKLIAALKKLTPEDRLLVEQQKFCPILENSRLGSMGLPVKVIVNGRPIFVCCPACEKPATDEPLETLKKVDLLKSKPPTRGKPMTPASPGTKDHGSENKIQATLAKLGDEDRRLAERQRECVILPGSRLGSMGVPRKLTIEGQPVFICCSGCEKAALAKPQTALKRLAELKARTGTEPGDEERIR